MPDYSNLAMVKDNVITRTPVSPTVAGLEVWQLGDEATMSQFDVFGIDGARWYPIIDRSPALTRYQSYDGDGVLSYEAGAREVTLTRAAIDWTVDEILAFKRSTIRRITELALRNRFTRLEKVAFEMSQVDDPTAAHEARLVAAGLRVMDKELAAAQYADLNDVALQVGLAQLEQLGVLGPGRADQITWGDIESHEVP